MAKNRASRNAPFGVLVIFGLFWSGMTLMFDGILARNAIHQLRTLTYSTTQGFVTHTDLECISDDEGGSYYRPIIKYTYSVAGQEYKGERRRYDEEGFGPRTAQRMVDAYPVGRPVEVHYAPYDPAEAVLHVGLEGIDFFHAMFMLPFNLVMLGLWIAGFGKVYYRLYRPRAGGARIWEDGEKLCVRLSSWRPLYTGAIVAGALAFAGVFIVDCGRGSNSFMPVMLTAWTVIIGGGLMAYLYHHFRLGPDGCDVVIGTFGNHVTILGTQGRKETIVVPREKVISIEVEKIEKRDSDGDVSYRYVPIVAFADKAGSTQRERLVEWCNESRTEELAAWLRERLRIEPANKDASPTTTVEPL